MWRGIRMRAGVEGRWCTEHNSWPLDVTPLGSGEWSGVEGQYTPVPLLRRDALVTEQSLSPFRRNLRIHRHVTHQGIGSDYNSEQSCYSTTADGCIYPKILSLRHSTFFPFLG